MAVLASHQWMFLDNLLVTVSSSGLIPAETWDSFIAAMREAKGTTRYLAATTGPIETTSIQRKEVFEVAKNLRMRVAVVTDERLTRGIVTAAAWVGVDCASFSWAEAQKAVSFLALPPALGDRALAAIEKMRRSA